MANAAGVIPWVSNDPTRSPANRGLKTITSQGVNANVDQTPIRTQGHAGHRRQHRHAFTRPRSTRRPRPFKLGLLTVKTGPLAQGGIQMEQGVLTFLKEKNNTMAGRKVEFFSADTGGNPAGTKTKVQELVERDKVDVILGPLAAFELLAITDYIAQVKTPLLSLAAAEDMTQRRPNPYFLRASATSAQAMHPMAEYAAKELKLKRIVTISEDFAFGHEQMGGFQRIFEDNGGKILQETVAAAGHAGLHALRRADRRLRRRLPGLRRIEPAALHEDLCRRRAEVPGGHRRNRRRRRFAQELRRRGARPHQLHPLYAGPRN